MSVLTYAICCVEIKSGRTFLSFSERAFDIILKSTFSKEMGLQFQYLEKLYELREHFPFLSERMKIEKTERLVVNLHDKTKNAIHIIIHIIIQCSTHSFKKHSYRD